MFAIELSVLISEAVFLPQVIKSISAQEEELTDEYAYLWIEMVKVHIIGSDRLFFIPALLIGSEEPSYVLKALLEEDVRGCYCGMTRCSPQHFL